MHPFHRTELLVGREGFANLQGARVLVVGLGGVGSFAAEALARSSVGTLGLVDFDQVCITNLNRQLHAFRKTVGQQKSVLMKERCELIHPNGTYRAWEAFYGADNADEILEGPWDWVVDAIDNVTAKLHLLQACSERGIPVVSSMGAGSRLDPTKVKVSDLWRTHTDPLARVVRKELRRRGVTGGVTAVWSEEPPNDLDVFVAEAFRCVCPNGENGLHDCDDRNLVQGTVSFLPSVFGMVAAGVVVNDLIGKPLPGTAHPA